VKARKAHLIQWIVGQIAKTSRHKLTESVLYKAIRP
jgi:hypothetical protein